MNILYQKVREVERLNIIMKKKESMQDVINKKYIEIEKRMKWMNLEKELKN